MSRKTRRIIFWTLVGFFIVINPLTVFYSKGYRFDFQKLEIFKIGGLNLQVKTEGAEIFINNRLRAQSGGLLYSGSFFKLLPKAYEVRVTKDNYRAWQKTLTVQPNLITDVYDIILFPENAEIKELTNEPVDFFSFSPDRTRILVAGMARDATTSLPILKTMLLDSSGNQVENFGDFSLKWLHPHTKQSSGAGIKNTQLKILSSRWSPGAESFLLKIEANKKTHWLLPMNNPKTKSREIALADEEIKKSLETARTTDGISRINAPLDEIFFNPQNPKELLFLLNGNIYAFNVENKIVRNPKINNNPTLTVLSFLTEGKNVWWLDKTGAVKKNDLNVNLIKETFKIPDFASSSAGDYLLVPWDDTFAIQSKTESYIYKKSGGEFIAVEGWIISPRISPDSKKLLYLKNGETIVRYLEEIKTGDIKKAGDEDLIMSGVKDAFWHKSSGYLVLILTDSIKIAELDGRPERNIFKIVKDEPKTVFYNQNNEKIYYLTGERTLKMVSLK